MRKQSYLYFGIAVAFLLASIAGYAFWFSLLVSAQKAVDAAAASVAGIEKEDAEIAAAKGALASVTNDEEAVHSYFLSPEDIVSFLEAFQSTGKSFGTVIDVVSVSPSKDGRIGLSLQVSGSFEAVMRTIGALEFGPHDTRMTSLTLDTIPNESGAPWTAATVFTVGTLASTTTP